MPQFDAWLATIKDDHVQRGHVVIVMLGGGSKRTQKADIAAARKLAATLED